MPDVDFDVAFAFMFVWTLKFCAQQDSNVFAFEELRKSLPRTKPLANIFIEDTKPFLDFDTRCKKALQPELISIHNDPQQETSSNKSRKRTSHPSPVPGSPAQHRVPTARRRCNTGKKNERAVTRALSRGIKLEWTKKLSGDGDVLMAQTGMLSWNQCVVMILLCKLRIWLVLAQIFQ